MESATAPSLARVVVAALGALLALALLLGLCSLVWLRVFEEGARCYSPS